jgi:hypothetical protein
VIGTGRVLVVDGDRLIQRGAGVGAVAERQVAARRQGIKQPGHHRGGAGGIGDLPQDAQHHQGDGLAEVQRPGGFVQDLPRVAHVGFNVAGGTAGGAGQQRAGMHQHERVVVHVDDPRLRRYLLSDLVSVVGGRQAGADVEELPDPGLAGQVTDRADQETALHMGDIGDVGKHPQDHVADLAVGREVILAAQQVIPDPGRVRDASVKLGRRDSLALR